MKSIRQTICGLDSGSCKGQSKDDARYVWQH